MRGIEVLGSGGWDWLNPPPSWEADEGGLRVAAAGGTDFWRTTHYGYDRDTGHLLGRRVAGDFTLTTTFRGEYRALYDQAGVMVHADERTWVKAGVELVDGALQFSVVVTRGFSDWSVLALPAGAGEVRMALQRAGDAVTVRFGLDGAAPTTLARLAYFPPDVEVSAGAMCASPEGDGFPVLFTELTLS